MLNETYNNMSENFKDEFDIVIVNPIKLRDSYATMALGTLTIGTILKKAGYRVKIIDFNYMYTKGELSKAKDIETNVIQMAEYILSLHPKLVGFSTISTCLHIALDISNYLKKATANKLNVFLGGHQASLAAKETLTYFNSIDLIMIGESENNIIPVVEALLNNTPRNEIKGIAYLENERIVVTEAADILYDLDEIPYLDYSMIPIDIELDKKNNITFPIEVGRSCPFHCTFCCTKTFWKQAFRMKSVKRLVEEIQFIHNEYGVNDFHLLHDLFTLKREIVIDFCNELINKNLKIRWICSARIDTVSEDMINSMADAGCKRIFLGIETASKEQQKRIKKNLKVDTIYPKVKMIRSYGIKVEAAFMYGFPDETKEDLNETLNMMLMGTATNLWFPEIGLLNVENGTELYEELKDSLYLEKKTDNLYFFDEAEYTYYFNMFKKYPDLFPHFYDFKNETRQAYPYLDKFMWILVTMIQLGYKISINALVSLYDSNILLCYDDVLRQCLEKFHSIFNENFNITSGNNIELVQYRAQLMGNFILNQIEEKRYDENSDLWEITSELFDLDNNIVMLRLLGDEQDKVEKIYSFNLLEVRKSGTIMKESGKYLISLIKDTSTKIRILGNTLEVT